MAKQGAEPPGGPRGAGVGAEDFGLRGPRGWAFRSVSFRAEPGSLVAITGPSGSGRTCLLLALTGRMRTAEGTAEVAGLDLPRRMAAVRRISALGHVPGVSELEPALTVAEHLRERVLLRRRFNGSLRELLRPRRARAATARARIDAALAAAGLDTVALPKGERTAVRDLERLQGLRLSVALALIGGPRLLAVDDTDLKLSDGDREEAWAMLRSVAASGTTVLAVCSDAPEGAVVVRAGVPAGAAQTPGAANADAVDADTATGTAYTDTDTGTGTGTGADAPGAGPRAEQGAGPREDRADRADRADRRPSAPGSGERTQADDARDTAGRPGPEDPDGKPAKKTEDDTEGAADALAETGRS
ncbi:ATP-binding cassette domain-containing protein [Streptomyces sp. NPDC047968]|uniref:ATP-binding cassette domain-containing protein n=1 Tax=unclassified Streptomyces TaxID=2593676 RepID=UPI00341E15D7